MVTKLACFDVAPERKVFNAKLYHFKSSGLACNFTCCYIAVFVSSAPVSDSSAGRLQSCVSYTENSAKENIVPACYQATHIL